MQNSVYVCQLINGAASAYAEVKPDEELHLYEEGTELSNCYVGKITFEQNLDAWVLESAHENIFKLAGNSIMKNSISELANMDIITMTDEVRLQVQLGWNENMKGNVIFTFDQVSKDESETNNQLCFICNRGITQLRERSFHSTCVKRELKKIAQSQDIILSSTLPAILTGIINKRFEGQINCSTKIEWKKTGHCEICLQKLAPEGDVKRLSYHYECSTSAANINNLFLNSLF